MCVQWQRRMEAEIRREERKTKKGREWNHNAIFP